MIILVKVTLALKNKEGMEIGEETDWGRTVNEAIQTILAENDWVVAEGDSLRVKKVEHQTDN